MLEEARVKAKCTLAHCGTICDTFGRMGGLVFVLRGAARGGLAAWVRGAHDIIVAEFEGEVKENVWLLFGFLGMRKWPV